MGQTPPRAISVQAHAKINLGLQVVGRRTDGYHELATVLQTVALADTVTASDHPTIDGAPSIPGLAWEADLVMRAAHALAARVRPGRGALLRTDKRIPVAAGMGGGSSDAAATLVALTDLWGTERRVLPEIGASLGTDVPFFLWGGTALATGRGERIEPLPAAPMRWVVLAKVEDEIATAAAYRALQPQEWSDGATTRALALALQRGNLPAGLMRNDLTGPALRLAPAIAPVLAALQAAGAAPAQVTGSGPTCFGLFRDETAARAAELKLRRPGLWTAVTWFQLAGALTPPDHLPTIGIIGE
ncbi:MAG: 4-(cytidine 5'-diphospho)-2-C-methyl-D-erythritol kinase [Actinobacteria bacterium]|nr:4-(cytidine 5'-diphospho)-2-C-methyl-D-erythritol kinase [Actinomycetota bacterium]